MDPNEIEQLHAVKNSDKLRGLVASMRENGYTGRPILVLDLGGNQYRAITGSHRIEAARIVGIDVPVLIVDVSDHKIGYDGCCVVCGESCWVADLVYASDDDERCDVLEASGYEDAYSLMCEEE